MGNQEIEASHEQIWDDTALVDSWNDALAEYKKYHSLYTKGGNSRDLKQAQESIAGIPNSAEDASARDGRESHSEVLGDAPEVEKPHVSIASSLPSPPQAVLSSMKDENLKKLLLSWYYTGYYTGLYEGQQQAQASKS